MCGVAFPLARKKITYFQSKHEMAPQRTEGTYRPQIHAGLFGEV